MQRKGYNAMEDEFGFEDISIKFSDKPEKRVGSDDIWEKSEKALKKPRKNRV